MVNVLCLTSLERKTSFKPSKVTGVVLVTTEASLRGLHTLFEQYSNDLAVCLAVFYHLCDELLVRAECIGSAPDKFSAAIAAGKPEAITTQRIPYQNW